MTAVRQVSATDLRGGCVARTGCHTAHPESACHALLELTALCQLSSRVSRKRATHKDSAVCRLVRRVASNRAGGQHVAQRSSRSGDSAGLAARSGEHQVVVSVAEKGRRTWVGKPTGVAPGTPAQHKVPARLALLSGRVRKLQPGRGDVRRGRGGGCGPGGSTLQRVPKAQAPVFRKETHSGGGGDTACDMGRTSTWRRGAGDAGGGPLPGARIASHHVVAV